MGAAKSPALRQGRARLAAAAVLALAAALILTLVMTRHSPRPTGHAAARVPSPVESTPATSATQPIPSVPTSSTAPAAPALVRTDDPVTYARAVAAALFDVAPADVTRPAFLAFWEHELPTVVYSDGAAKGLTLRAQNADAIDNLTSYWIPTQAVWTSDAEQRTTGHIQITSVTVPDYWVNAVADGTLRDPGLRMERVMGVLTQSYGTSTRETSSTSVVIDLGLLCGPTQPGGCRLLAPQQPVSAGS